MIVEYIVLFALIVIILYVLFTKNSVEGMISLGSASDYGSSTNTITTVISNRSGSYQQTAQSLLKETEQYPKSQKTMLNILDSDLMRFFDASPRQIAELRDAVASATGDVTDIRAKIKELVKTQQRATNYA